MKVVFCWTDISGYMAACWRELSRLPDIDLLVIATGQASFDKSVMNGLNYRILSRDEVGDYVLLKDQVLSHRPDVLVISGWTNKAYVRLAFDPELSAVLHVLTMDNPIRSDLRQLLGRIKLSRFLNRIDLVFVPGERAWQLARYFGVAENKIRRGVYGFDYDRFSNLLDLRLQNEWPRDFLFVGSYDKRKGFDLLVDAYAQYRAEAGGPWRLRCCGAGPLSALLEGQPGIEDLGFVQPMDLPDVLSAGGVFILPSRYDAWGVVIAEACAAGLPVICSESCGASVEIVRELYNGIAIATDSVKALRDAMLWMHNNYGKLPEMGERSRQMAAPYSAQMWANRFLDAVRSCNGSRI